MVKDIRVEQAIKEPLKRLIRKPLHQLKIKTKEGKFQKRY
jgi:hypothetical protein